MCASPYRTLDKRAEELFAPDEEHRLGALRSVHEPLLLTWRPWRRGEPGGCTVLLHEHGVVLGSGDGRQVVLFEDVDEVWFDRRGEDPETSRILALRVVDHKGVATELPVDVIDIATVARAFVRRCSDPLLAPARRALAEGQLLTFARHRLHRRMVAGTSWWLPWADVESFEIESDRLAFYCDGLMVPQHIIALRDVPHPTLFAKLALELSPPRR